MRMRTLEECVAELVNIWCEVWEVFEHEPGEAPVKKK